MNMQWRGVMPAITTAFNEDLSVDLDAVGRHCRWLVDSGCTGVVALGSLGEGAALNPNEKIALLEACVEALDGRAPLVAGVAAFSTREAVSFAKAAGEAGCSGLMVLPPYVYLGDWRETKAHVAAVFEATDLSCMLYNNPIAYRVDFLPEQVLELMEEHDNFEAIKESSADVRRVAALRAICEDDLEILCGVDDLIVEAVGAGAVGWIAGLANAFPKESIELFERPTFDLYKWFLPLLRMDTVPKFVQLIKLVQQEAGRGSQRVRPPRLELTGPELEIALATILEAMSSR